MQMLDWLKANHMSISEVARHFDVAPITLQRHVTGQRWPSSDIMVRCYRLTNRQVDLVDWIETCRELLVQQGTIQPGDDYGRTESTERAEPEAGTGGGGGKGEEDGEPDPGA